MNLGTNKLDYQKLFEMSSLSIAIATADKKIMFTNRQFLNTFEITGDQIKNKKISDFFDLNEAQLNKLTNCRVDTIAFKENILCCHSNGEYSEFFVVAKKVSLPYGNGQGFYLEFLDNDVTSQKQVQQSPQSLQKIGKITSQISHDISNPLAILQIHCDSVKIIAEKTDNISSEDIMKRMSRMSNATSRITDTTNKLKFFSKKLLDGDEEEIQKIWEESKILDGHQLPVKDD